MNRSSIDSELVKVGSDMNKILRRRSETLEIKRITRAACRESYTGGRYIEIGAYRGLARLEIFLDRYSGLIRHRFWYGFSSSNPNNVAQLNDLLSLTRLRRSSLHFTNRDVTRSEGFYRLRRELALKEFDRVVRESYGSAREYYLGVYSPYEVPLSRSDRGALAREASNFYLAIARLLGPKSEFRQTRVAAWRKPDRLMMRRIERAAVTATRRWLARRGYSVRSRESEICGYDLLASHPGRDSWHVEVKGTAGSFGHFILTPNENDAASADPRWRLAMVTHGLSRPSLRIFDLAKMKRTFSLTPTGWEANEL